MKIEEPLTLSSLKDHSLRLSSEAVLQTEINVMTSVIDTAGMQFLVMLKKSRPNLNINLESSEAKNLAALLGVDKCL